MMATETEPRAWVGCLACYNAGRLVGEWVDGTEAGEVTPDQLHECICARTETLTTHDDECHYGSPHEELWVMDHEGFHGLLTGECSPSAAQAIAEELAEVDEPEAYAAYWAHVGGDRDVASFDDAWSGEWSDFDTYAEQLADDIDAFGLAQMDADQRGRVEPYIDYKSWARDLLLGGDFFTVDSDGGVYVFRNQ